MKLYYAKAVKDGSEDLYLREDGEWVPSKGEAQTFETELAGAAAAKGKLPEGTSLDTTDFKEVPDAEEMHEAIDKADVPDEVKAVAHEGVKADAPKKAEIKPPVAPFIAKTVDFINEQGLHIQHLEAVPGHILPPDIATRPYVAHARSDIPVTGAGVVPNVPIAAKFAAESIEDAYAKAEEEIQAEALRVQKRLEAQYQREQIAGAGRMGMGMTGMNNPPGPSGVRRL